MEIECPECYAYNEVCDIDDPELIKCWACGHEFEYEPED